ncbi:hypothetical protein CC78DRAFT_587864 [Lojkania enalia]|uniref:Uncharacterized protein n=1 Tax=Lojkania enalia TaxID=147567 RepID=A0A9P4MXU7_9PLEO|nr:hypothetical protein CC78DRAFT_587864 [Didymosphaeria enalia]
MRGSDFAARSRSAKVKDTGSEFDREIGQESSEVTSRGTDTDDSGDVRIEDIQNILEDKFLIEMYPGLTALLRKEGEYHVFIRICPHALSDNGVDKLVDMWSRVVDGGGPEERMGKVLELLGTRARPRLMIR